MKIHNAYNWISNSCRTLSGSLNNLTSRYHYSSQSNNTLKPEVPQLPKSARVVIGGGGISGPSIAYHLSERGWNDIVLLEQGRLTCGTTWHSVGLCGQLRSDLTEMKITCYGRDLYKKFEEEGHGIGWKDSGSISLARTKDRMTDFKRKHAMTSASGFETHLLTPREIQEKCPVIRTDDLQGGIWIPTDGTVTAPDVTMVFSKLAKKNGAKFMEGVKVEKILTKNDRVTGVETSAGNIDCEYFVNCGGLWAREMGIKSTPNVSLPLHSCEHFYVVTKPLKEVERLMPVIRDHDGYICIREWNGGLCIGGFEPNPKPCFHTGVPDKFEFQLLPEDWDQFQVLMDECLLRVPIMQKAEIRQLVNGPESFTPDSNWLLGETPEISNYYVAAGMNSRGIISSGGVGKYMAEWIIDGRPSINLWKYDVRRFTKQHNDNSFLKDRICEVLGKMFSLNYPQTEQSTGRKLQTTPLHDVLQISGAVFGQTMAFEQPLWFDSSRDKADLYIHKGSFGKPVWFDSVQHEYRVCKDAVGLVDVSAQTKLEIRSAGNEALEYLQYLCSNNIDLEKGTIIHTGMQNEQGGFENDCSIARLGNNNFFMICPATQKTRALSWLRRHLPADGSVQVSDVTSMYSGIKLIGPHAQALLDDVTDVSTQKKDFEVMTCRFIDVGNASGIRAMRLTHAGEDGFILYIPSEYALHVYDTLMTAGTDYGIRNAGYYAIRHLRVEKSFAYWGLDLDEHTTPLECGREFRVKFGVNFIGKEALQKQRKEGVSRKFAQFMLEDFDVDTDIWPWGGEPIYRNGVKVGSTATCGYGFTLERMVCLGFVSDLDQNGNPKINPQINDYVMDKEAVYEIDISGKRFKAKPGIHTPKLALSSVDPSLLAFIQKDT
ncbi:hypothetical protein LOTGIDRAFT_218009 [Lottia gigantea]|uniref:Pyruvate dehydrogenase phosphatase regulatory subunit, mitochondrial n=1 Tax=Lottia gigantea TaxID=225164 RepID=V4A0U0_LOTGI|nr:hypothetical protein LOTGIDRAFT_218009 [Lottia gigantea]ESO90302.1 hypothetical protein LOTGIDRAFT_218009 [Lottia gigantea]